MHDPLKEEGPDASVNGNEPQVQDVMTKSRRIFPVLELANRLVEEAERAEEIESLTVRAQCIVQAAGWKADCLLSEARALADDVTEEMRSALTRVNDLISALTPGIDVLPASNNSADGSNDKLGVGNGHVDVPALSPQSENEVRRGSIDYTEQGEEGTAKRLQMIEAERVPAANKRFEYAAKLAGKEVVTSQTIEGAPSREKDSGGWEMKKQGWWRGILSG